MTTYLNPNAIEGYSEAQQGKLLAKGSDGIEFVDGGAGSLIGLSDVNISSPTSKQALRYNSTSGMWENTNVTDVSGVNDGTNWTSITIGGTTKLIPSGGSGGSTTLEGLKDVNLSHLEDLDILSYSERAGKWLNRPTIAPQNLPGFAAGSVGQVLAKTTNVAARFVTLSGKAPAYVDQTGVLAPYTHYYTKGEVDSLLATKQQILVSGTNIKTLNGGSMLGSGNISIPNLSFHHKNVTTFANSWTFDDTTTEGYNRCYYTIDYGNNANITLAFTNTDEHYLLIHNTSASSITMSIVSAAGTSAVGNTAIQIGAGEYFEISLIKASSTYIITERKLTTPTA